MNKLELLSSRRAEIVSAGSEIRKKIAALTDSDSFAETDSYSFSKNDFYETAGGEGVICGCASINENAVYIVAQNRTVKSGAVTEANCKKIVKCQEKALRAGAPIIYLLSTNGVQVGEGIGALEGMAKVLSMVNELKGEVPQISVCDGDVFGSFALISAACDYNFMFATSCAAYASPLVISASSGKNLAKDEVGGVKSAKYNALTTFEVKEYGEIRETLAKVLDLLPAYNGEAETGDDYNRSAPALNEKVCAKCLIEAIFDKDYFMELGKGFAPEIITGVGRVGGIAAAAIVFDGGDDGVELNSDNISKIKEFIYYCDENDFPLLTFVNARGIKADLSTAQRTVMKEVANLSYALNNLGTSRINVVYGKAIGLGYTLFASKEFGADFTYAFATAKISLFDSAKGAMIELDGVNEANKEQAEAKYADENQDPINAAKNGYIDDIIEPQFVRGYVINALQLLER